MCVCVCAFLEVSVVYLSLAFHLACEEYLTEPGGHQLARPAGYKSQEFTCPHFPRITAHCTWLLKMFCSFNVDARDPTQCLFLSSKHLLPILYFWVQIEDGSIVSYRKSQNLCCKIILRKGWQFSFPFETHHTIGSSLYKVAENNSRALESSVCRLHNNGKHIKIP